MYIKQIEKGQNWVEGVFDGYRFQAKLFVYPSDYGINNGRVSKLSIQNIDTKETVINYDRGWDIGKGKKKLLKVLLPALDAYAISPDFANQFPSEGV